MCALVRRTCAVGELALGELDWANSHWVKDRRPKKYIMKDFWHSSLLLDVLDEELKELVSISPEANLFEAIRSLLHNRIHRLPVIDPETGNVLYIITHKRILRFLFLYVSHCYFEKFFKYN